MVKRLPLENICGGALQEVRPGRMLHVAARAVESDTTIFFVHGGGGNKEQFRFQWEHFAAMPIGLVAWDAMGHGKSPQPRDRAAYLGAALVADMQAVFARYRSGRTIVVAHSYGVRLVLAWLLGAEAPAIDGLVFLGAAPLGNMGARLLPGWLGRLPLPLLELARPLLSRGFRRLAWYEGADPALVEAEQQATRGNSLFMMQALLAGAPAIDEAGIGGVGAPATILAGDHDGLVPMAASEKLAALLPNAHLRLVPRCGHQIMLEAPGMTNEVIGQMLAGVQHGA